MDFIIKQQIIMKSPVFRLLQRVFANFNLLEFIMPIASILIGRGIIFRSSKLIEFVSMIQMILYFAFLEMGSQVVLFYKRDFLYANTKHDVRDERNATILLFILFFGMSILPLSNILLDSRAGPTFFIFLAISSFVIIVWRNIGETPINQIISYFIFSFVHSFLIPLTQLVFYRLNANTLFITISQVLFLFLFGYLIIREIFQIEIRLEPRRIVQIIGTIPLLRMAEILFFLGTILLVIYSMRKPEVEIITFTSVSAGIFLLTLNQTIRLDRDGKQGLKTIYQAAAILLLSQYLGWYFILWML
jgi:hypothetical protein